MANQRRRRQNIHQEEKTRSTFFQYNPDLNTGYKSKAETLQPKQASPSLKKEADKVVSKDVKKSSITKEKSQGKKNTKPQVKKDKTENKLIQKKEEKEETNTKLTEIKDKQEAPKAKIVKKRVRTAKSTAKLSQKTSKNVALDGKEEDKTDA